MTSKAYVTEYGGVANGLSVGQGPAINTQVIDFSGGAAATTAFTENTRFVRVYVDSYCSVAEGTSPVATTSSKQMAADSSEYWGVRPGDKLSFIINSGSGAALLGKVSIDQANPGTTNAIDQATQSKLISIPAAATFNRPGDTTAYAIGDLIANSTTAGSVAPLSWTGVTISGAGGSGEITEVTIDTGDSAAHTVRVHFFSYSPTVSNGDNGALIVSNFARTTAAYYLGYADVVMQTSAIVAAGNNVGQAAGLSIPYKLASGDTLYSLLESQTVFTPGNASNYFVTPRFKRYS